MLTDLPGHASGCLRRLPIRTSCSTEVRKLNADGMQLRSRFANGFA
jgi:hypothetical protein